MLLHEENFVIFVPSEWLFIHLSVELHETFVSLRDTCSALVQRKTILPTLIVLLLFPGIQFLQSGCKKNDDTLVLNAVPDSVTDIDGNIYHTVKIGTQAWLAENLRTAHYRNGEAIPNVTVPSQWGMISYGAWSSYNNDEANAKRYGRLYNWFAVADSRNLCPVGWHIPSGEEWAALMDFLEGELAAGGKLKEQGIDHWLPPNTGATNSSGFTAIPAGYRNDQGVFANVMVSAIFWSSAQQDATHAWYHYLYYNYEGMYKDCYHDKTHGFSIRCIMDK